MLRNLILLFLGTFICQSALALEIPGVGTNGLRPVVGIQRYGDDWLFQIDLIAQADFSRTTWLKITNRVGSKLRVWNTNGVECLMKDPSALAALTLPVDTTVPAIMRGVDRSRQGLQWWRTNLKGVKSGKRYPVTTFGLAPQFGVGFTNDIILGMNPLIYRVDADTNAAHLIEFPAIRLKLKADGTVERLE
jgi:hypothetical protein